MATTVTPALPRSVVDFLSAGHLDMFVGKSLVPAASGATFDSVNPVTGQLLARLPAADREDVDRAVRAARAAYDGAWGAAAPAERAKLLLNLADLIEADIDALSTLECLDNGKPVAYAMRHDIPGVVEVLRYFAGWATKVEGETLSSSAGTDFFPYTLREPLGVVGAIVPWNYPLLVAVWKIAPALATGNSVLLKPAEQTPLTALWLARLAAKAGFPDGALSVLTGSGEQAGAAITGIPTSMPSYSPARHRSGARSCGPARAISSGSPWSSAGSHRTSCSRMPTFRPRSPAPRTPSSTTWDKTVRPVHGSSCTRTSTTSSWPASSRRPNAGGSGMVWWTASIRDPWSAPSRWSGYWATSTRGSRPAVRSRPAASARSAPGSTAGTSSARRFLPASPTPC